MLRLTEKGALKHSEEIKVFNIYGSTVNQISEVGI